MYKRGSPKNAIKENEGASKGTPFEALIACGIDRFLVRDLIKNCPLQFLHFQSSLSLRLQEAPKLTLKASGFRRP